MAQFYRSTLTGNSDSLVEEETDVAVPVYNAISRPTFLAAFTEADSCEV